MESRRFSKAHSRIDEAREVSPCLSLALPITRVSVFTCNLCRVSPDVFGDFANHKGVVGSSLRVEQHLQRWYRDNPGRRGMDILRGLRLESNISAQGAGILAVRLRPQPMVPREDDAVRFAMILRRLKEQPILLVLCRVADTARYK